MFFRETSRCGRGTSSGLNTFLARNHVQRRQEHSMDQCDDQQEPEVILRGVSRNNYVADMPISNANGKKLR
jgi:hypothetical protein